MKFKNFIASSAEDMDSQSVTEVENDPGGSSSVKTRYYFLIDGQFRVVYGSAN